MSRIFLIGLICIASYGLVAAQESSSKRQNQPPRSDSSSEESSSKDGRADISPPKDDAKNHPYSSSSPDESDKNADDVQEFHPWDPHRAAKNVEVGDFYFKRKNYHAAEDRYREALLYKPNDAMATLHLAETQEKLGELDEAQKNYEGYLKILPHGQFEKEAHEAIDRLSKETSKNNEPK